jgi:hypothetical protein
MSGIMYNVSDINEEDNDDDLSPMQVFLIVYLVVVFLVGVSVNTSLLLTFFRKSSLRTTSNRLVVFHLNIEFSKNRFVDFPQTGCGFSS